MGARGLSGPPAASRNLTPSVQSPVCPSVGPFLLCPHPIGSTISHCLGLSPIVGQQGPFLCPVGNGNEMSTAGDVGRGTAWHLPPEKGACVGVGLEQGLPSPRRAERVTGRELPMGSPQHSEFQGSKEICVRPGRRPAPQTAGREAGLATGDTRISQQGGLFCPWEGTRGVPRMERLWEALRDGELAPHVPHRHSGR